MNVALDSNAYSAAMENDARMSAIIRDADIVYLSVIVIGEQIFGFHRGNRLEHNYRVLEAFINRPYVRVVEVSRATAERYGRIYASLRDKGRPIPTNDIWIAAHAMEYDAYLVTRDSDFDHVDGLEVMGF